MQGRWMDRRGGERPTALSHRLSLSLEEEEEEEWRKRMEREIGGGQRAPPLDISMALVVDINGL